MWPEVIIFTIAMSVIHGLLAIDERIKRKRRQ